MGKRKRSEKDMVEAILRKVKKMAKKKRRILSSSESEDEAPLPPTTVESPVCDLETYDEIPITETLSDDGEESCLDLAPDILELLGNDPTQTKVHGEDLHKDLASRWNYILTNGLPKEEKASILVQYLPAVNCTHMKAPTLNLELKSALSETNVKKDAYSEQKQNQMSGCIAAIGKALNLALSQSQNVPQEVIKTLSDAGRLLCDTHYRESLARRFAIINAISKNKREVLKTTKIDDQLFGQDLAEHLKSSKAITKSASELRPTKYVLQTNTYRRPETLNARGASRTAAAAEPRVNPDPLPARRPVQPQLRDQRQRQRRQPPPPPPPPARARPAYRQQNWRR